MASYTFTIIIEKEPEDPGYYAYSPTLPGCFGAGLTVEEARASMRQGLALHVESLLAHGEPVPQPVEPLIIEEVPLEVEVPV